MPSFFSDQGPDGVSKSMSGYGDIPGFVLGNALHISAPNAHTQIYIDTPLGKANGILMGLLFQMRRWGFKVEKVYEWMEVSPVHQQYYQLTVGQKQQLEGQIKTALAGVQNAISDYELLEHDIRRYKEYMSYFNKIEEGRKKKDEKMVKENEQLLKSVFIDKVDVHTGEGVALKLIVSRWPTIIVDFMKLNDDDNNASEVATKYGFSQAEGVVLTTKNKIYQEWKRLFRGSVVSRMHHLTELAEARKKSIEEYRNMAKPYIMRYRNIREFGETGEGRGFLRALSWLRPATQAISLEAAEYWAYKPFWIPEIHRPSMDIVVQEDIPISKFQFEVPQYKEALMKQLSMDKSLEKRYKTLNTFYTGIEPIDYWCIYLAGKLQDYYKTKHGYKSVITPTDVLDARKRLSEIYMEHQRWGWLVSPYFMTAHIPSMRLVGRSGDGSEFETITFGDYAGQAGSSMPLKVSIDTQNVMLVRFLELKLIEKELENYITDMLGETASGRSISSIIKEKYPYVMGSEEGKPYEEVSIPILPKPPKAKFRLVKPGHYEHHFFDRVAALGVKFVNQNTYAGIVKYIKSAAPL